MTELEQISRACPAQWTAVDPEGALVYARYRWGVLTVDRFEPGCEWDWERCESLYDLSVGHPFDGWMTTEEMVALTGMTEL